MQAVHDQHEAISIHAPREGERRGDCVEVMKGIPFQSTLPARGSDMLTPPNMPQCLISIHAPREGERPSNGKIDYLRWEFQSTLPARGSDAHKRF